MKNKEREGEAVSAGIFVGGEYPSKSHERSGGISAKPLRGHMLLDGVDIA